jgi:hypothetical protein
MLVSEVIELLKSHAHPTPENLKGMARYGINTGRALDSFRRPARINLGEDPGQNKRLICLTAGLAFIAAAGLLFITT